VKLLRYQWAARVIEEMITDGEYAIGEFLPKQRDLADRLNMAPGTVARAIGLLRVEGVIETRHGFGSMVVRVPKTSVRGREVMGARPLSRIEVADTMRRWIKDGRYGVGRRLPTQAEFAARLNVTVRTVRHAQAPLQREGLIYTKPGAGVWIRQPESPRVSG
jgi:DNA-binding GntR family transcriptional regulator